MSSLMKLVLIGSCILTASCGGGGHKVDRPVETTAPAPENIATDRDIHMLHGKVKTSYNLTKKNPSDAEWKSDRDPEQELPKSRSSVVVFNDQGYMTSLRAIYRTTEGSISLFFQGDNIHGQERKLTGYTIPGETNLIEFITSSTDKQHANQTIRTPKLNTYIHYEMMAEQKKIISESITINNESGDTTAHEMITSYGWNQKEYLEVSRDILKGTIDSVMVNKINVDSMSNATKTLKKNLRTGKVEEVSYDKYEYY